MLPTTVTFQPDVPTSRVILKISRFFCRLLSGFNAGHSSFNFLTARRGVAVHSFDVGRRRHVQPIATILRRAFPGRLTVEIGDSRLTVPRFFKPAARTTQAAAVASEIQSSPARETSFSAAFGSHVLTAKGTQARAGFDRGSTKSLSAARWGNRFPATWKTQSPSARGYPVPTARGTSSHTTLGTQSHTTRRTASPTVQGAPTLETRGTRAPFTQTNPSPSARETQKTPSPTAKSAASPAAQGNPTIEARGTRSPSIQKNPSPSPHGTQKTPSPASCDLILVDGGHGFDVALSDIRNMADVASLPRNVIIVDDVNIRPVRTAWGVAVRSGIVQQIFSCRFGNSGRAFAVGTVRRKHTLISN